MPFYYQAQCMSMDTEQARCLKDAESRMLGEKGLEFQEQAGGIVGHGILLRPVKKLGSCHAQSIAV